MFYGLFWQDPFPQHSPIWEAGAHRGARSSEGIVEVFELAPNGRSVYAFELDEGSRLRLEASSDGPIVVGLATFSEYERWVDSEDPSDELKALQMQPGLGCAKIKFRANFKEEYAVVVVSLADSPIQVIVGANYS